MNVVAQWRGPGRLEILVSGIAPGEEEGLLERLGVEETLTPLPNLDAVGYAQGFTGGTFFPAVYHWFSRGWSACRRWRADRATGPFVPVLVGEAQTCRQCEAAA